MDLRTNYREDYINRELPVKQTAPNSAKEIVLEKNVYTRRPMNGISQTSFDFRPYPKHRRTPAADMEPFQSQISIGNSYQSVEKFVIYDKILLKIFLDFSRDSQYRVDYPGYDTNQHPRPVAAIPKDRQQLYIPPLSKMDSQTVTQVILIFESNFFLLMLIFIERLSTY